MYIYDLTFESVKAAILLLSDKYTPAKRIIVDRTADSAARYCGTKSLLRIVKSQ